MKRHIKSIGIAAAKILGPRLPTTSVRRWFCERIAPLLMDPAVLPRGLVERPLRRIRVRVPCDPYVYVHRNGYWCGIFYEEEVESYLIRELKPGDTVIDIGANVGHVALPAAALVGPGGRVLAFEPNPELAALVLECARKQGLPVKMHAYGLGDEEGSSTLKMEPDHAGGATFRNLADARDFSRSLLCEVRRADDVIGALHGRVFLKIDVEGFELKVLHGMRETLKRVDHAIVEVSPQWLGSDGVARLFEMMALAGLEAHFLGADGSILAPARPAEIAGQINVLFLRTVPSERAAAAPEESEAAAAATGSAREQAQPADTLE